MGQKPSDQEIFRLITDADPNNSGKIMYNAFKSIINERQQKDGADNEEDLLDAFVAMGGEPNGDGAIDADKLIRTIKEEFEMTIDIEKLIEEIDEDGSG